MDERYRDLERRAKAGDLEAAHRWLTEAGRLKDYVAIHAAILLIAELQQPGLMKQLREIDEMVQRVKVQEVEIAPPQWTTYCPLVSV